MANTFYQVYIHYIFSTKNRKPLIRPEFEKRLWSYISGIGNEQGYPVLAIGGMADHLHILVSLSPTVSFSKTIQSLKGSSSKWMNDNFYEDSRQFKWQSGYGAFSIGRSGLTSTKKYIHNQKKHHHNRTYEEEFLGFLKKYQIEYDERFLWG
ncbi:MAG: IS200/IS605 family transposase [Balneolaceae bacterium]